LSSFITSISASSGMPSIETSGDTGVSLLPEIVSSSAAISEPSCSVIRCGRKQQLSSVHVILRNASTIADDPYVLRAAELLFRPQRMTLHEGSLIAADEETISGKSDTPVSPLVSNARHSGRGRDRCDERRQCRPIISSIATSSTSPSISPAAGAACRRWAPQSRAGSGTCSRSRSRSSRSSKCARRN